MAIPIAPTPFLTGKSAERFDRIMKENEKKPVPAGTGNVKCPAGADYGAVFESGGGFKG